MKLISFILAAFLSLPMCFAQKNEQNFRLGKPDASLFKIEQYAKDTSAPAAIIYDDFHLNYRISNTADLWKYTTLKRRIKVFSNEGTEYANVEISLLHPGNHRCMLEHIEACAINMENGKMVKSPVKKEHIFREKANENETIVKFTIPNVKEGTVIDYTYTVKSSILADIPYHEFQHEIPVAYSIAKYDMPDFFYFNVKFTNNSNIKLEQSEDAKGYAIGNSSTVIKEKCYTAVGRDIPAAKDEPFLWNYHNHLSKIGFELYAHHFPGDFYTPISANWKSVNETLKDSKFSDYLKMSNPLAKETGEAIAGLDSESKKIRAILHLLHSKIKWDQYFNLTPSASPKSALSKGSGNSAQINLLLNSMLNDAGFKTSLVLMNPRFLPNDYRPTLENINHFIIQVHMSNGKVCYVDGTNKHSDINVLPAILLTDGGHIYGDNSANLVNLTKISKNNAIKRIHGKITADGDLHLNIEEMYANMEALEENERIAKYSSEDEYIEKLEASLGREVADFTLEQNNLFVKRGYSYVRPVDATHEFIYLSTNIISIINTNPFKASQRLFPIEFHFPTSKRYEFEITIPEGCTVESLPAESFIAAAKVGMKAKMKVIYQDHTIKGVLEYHLDRINYTAQEYDEIKSFYDKLINIASQQIVIKRQ